MAALLAHSAWARALARRLTADLHGAEDLLQEAWTVALERPPASPGRAWLRRVLTNGVSLRHRRAERRDERERAAARDGTAEATADVVARAEAQRALVASVLGLDEPYRSTLLLRYFDGLSCAAIARRAGVPSSTVRTRVERGLAELRERLERERGASWAALLVPLARPPRGIPGSALAAGVGVMTVKTAGTVACVLALAGLGWWLAAGSGPAEAPAEGSAPRAAPALATDEAPEVLTGEAARTPLQEDASDQASAPVPPDALTGRVTTPTGAPVRDAEVRVVRPLARLWPHLPEEEEPLGTAGEVVRTTRTDAQGAYRVRVPEERLLDLEVAAEGFGTERRPNVVAGGRVDVVLQPAARLRGRVTRADGLPAAGERVEVKLGTLAVPGRTVLRTETDADGQYELAGLTPDLYLLEYAFLAQRYVTLTAGEDRELDVVFPAAPVVEGRVTDARTDVPIAGARVWLGFWQERGTTTDTDGRYRVEVEPDGPLRMLTFEAAGHARHEVAVEAIGPEGAVRDVALEPGSTARGRLVDPQGAPVAGAWVAAASQSRTDRLVRRDARTTRSDAEGRFELPHLRPDLCHTLIVRAPDLAVAVFDLPAPWEGTLDLGTLPLELRTLVSGRVVDARGNPLEGIVVTPWIEPRERDRLGPTEEGDGYVEELGSRVQTMTDRSGRFVLDGLPSGEWYLSASRKGWATSGEADFTLAAGERRTDVEIVVETGLPIAGVAVDARGTPVPAAAISVLVAGTTNRVTYAYTDAAGRFFLNGIAPGTYRIEGSPHAWAEGSHAEAALDEVPAGREDLRLVFPDAVPLRVHVIDRQGDSLPGAWVGLVDSKGTIDFQAADRDGRTVLEAPGGIPVAVCVAANRHFDPRGNFMDGFFTEEDGSWTPGLWTTLEGVVAGPEELVVTIPGLP